MKKVFGCFSILFICSISILFAEIPEPAQKHFDKNYMSAENIRWSQIGDSANTIYFADFTIGDVKKRVKYKNSAFFSLSFPVETAYRPAKIVNYITDTIGSNYKIEQIFIEQKNNKSVYCVILNSSKKKIRDIRQLYFNLTGNFINEIKETEFFDFTK